MEIGYVPYSPNLEHPGDRRRLANFAKNSQIALNLNDFRYCETLVLSANANYNYWIEKYAGRIFIDLVDGYIGSNPSFVEDFGRNFIRSLDGRSQFGWIRFTKHLKHALRKSSGVIVSSPELAVHIADLNENVHIIPDYLSELKSEKKNKVRRSDNQITIAWEGFGFTLKHFRFISKELDRFLYQTNAKLLLFTTHQFPSVGLKYLPINTMKFMQSILPNSFQNVELIPWSVTALKENANRINFAIIPLDPDDYFASLKPENRLISWLTLGVPAFVSPTPAYERVLRKANSSEFLILNNDWKNFFDNVMLSNQVDFDVKAELISELNLNYSEESLSKKWINALELGY